MIKKPSIIITSLGRTGTSFFAKFFQNNFEDTDSCHEPASIHYQRQCPTVKELMKNSRNFGLFNAILKKLFKKWGIINISNKKISLKISGKEAADMIIKERKKFIDEINTKPFYLESNYHFYGLIDALPLAFEKFIAIYIIRDPRDWVASHINHKCWYHRSDALDIIGSRLAPKYAGDAKYEKKWKRMSQFEKLCWAWNFINSRAIKAIDGKNTKLFLFEEIFSNKNEKFFELTSFVNDFIKNNNGRGVNMEGLPIEDILKNKVHEPLSRCFPGWAKWSPAQSKSLNDICGPLMKKFGYGEEREWKEKINQS